MRLENLRGLNADHLSDMVASLQKEKELTVDVFCGGQIKMGDDGKLHWATGDAQKDATLESDAKFCPSPDALIHIWLRNCQLITNTNFRLISACLMLDGCRTDDPNESPISVRDCLNTSLNVYDSHVQVISSSLTELSVGRANLPIDISLAKEGFDAAALDSLEKGIWHVPYFRGGCADLYETAVMRLLLYGGSVSLTRLPATQLTMTHGSTLALRYDEEQPKYLPKEVKTTGIVHLFAEDGVNRTLLEDLIKQLLRGGAQGIVFSGYEPFDPHYQHKFQLVTLQGDELQYHRAGGLVQTQPVKVEMGL